MYWHPGEVSFYEEYLTVRANAMRKLPSGYVTYSRPLAHFVDFKTVIEYFGTNL
jgi:hypothetical protein